MNDANLQACSPRAGRSNGFISGPFRAIFRSASSLASSVRSAGSSVASTITSVEEDRQSEQLQWACFDKVELPQAGTRRVLLLTYANGFQVWDVENADDVSEVVSKRDGPATFLRMQPHPIEAGDDEFKSARPLMLVVTSDSQNCRNGGFSSGYNAVIGSPPMAGENIIVPTLVKFYSLRTHSYVHTLRFRTAIFAVRCSSRVVAVALATQLYCFDAATLQSTFSVLTYPSPQPGPSGFCSGYGAVAVGPRWLAYAANQPLLSVTGRVSPQHLSPSPGVSPSTSPANGSLVAHYAKESSKQLAAGIVTLGDLGYKALSRYYSEGAGSPVSGSPFLKSSSNGHPEHAGTVIVRDFVTKAVVSQFRAHESPLSALTFDPTGTLLVTASIHGHSINVFRIMPVSNLSGSSYDTNSSYVHLYKLSRGMTNAVIQDIAFSEDSHWIVVSSSRGTNHLFAISPFGGPVGKSTHGASLIGQVQSKPWWSSLGPLRSSPHASRPPPMMNLSVVSRIKNGNGGWRGTVSGAAAAAASGWNCSSLGAVAVVFHNGQSHNLDNEGGQGSLKEQLWVLSPSGHLIRHALHLLAGTEAYSDRMASDCQKEGLDLKVMLEPLQKWDLCRRPNWMEREEAIKSSSAVDVTRDESRILMGSFQNGGPFEREETAAKDLTTNEMQQWFLSNAEVQMHHSRPPMWASSQFSFHVLSGAYNEGMQKDDLGGEIEIEKFISNAVEIRKRDLVPVFDMLKGYQFGEDMRKSEFSLKDGLNSSSLQSATILGTKADGKGCQRYCSSGGSSSSGSAEGLFINAGSNNCHSSNKDHAVRLQSQPMMNTSSLDGVGALFYAEGREVQGTHYPTASLSNAKKDAVSLMTGSPPMDIPCLGHQHSLVVDSQTGITCEYVSQKTEIAFMSSHVTNVAENNGMTFTCETRQMDVARLSNGGLGNHESYAPTDPAVTRSDSRWVSCIAEEASPSKKPVVNKTSESLMTVVHSHLQNIDLQGYDAVAEDVESNDGNSKSEDFAGEQGEDGFEGHAEDGWEGAMFPFVEDC